MREGGVIVRIGDGPWQWMPDIPTGAQIGFIGGSGKIWCRWGETNYTFGNSPYKWSQPCTQLVVEVLRHTGGPEPESALGDWLKRHPDKKKKLIQVLCVINGKEFSEKEYANSDIKLTVSDVKLLAKHVLGIDVDAEVTVDESSIKQI